MPMNYTSLSRQVADAGASPIGIPSSDVIQAALSPALLEEDALVRRIREQEYLTHTLEGSHEEQLAVARAGKRACRGRPQPPSAQVLPNEVLIRVFEYLLMDQRALLSSAAVCLDWNNCATGILYRYPQFSSTLHWALFIQTLSRSKESKTPNIRRRRSILPNRPQQTRQHSSPSMQTSQIKRTDDPLRGTCSRLYTNLGEFVRGIDLSPKTVHIDQAKCSCSLAQEPLGGNRNCIIHSETQNTTPNPTVRLGPVSPSNPLHVSSSRSGQGPGPLAGDPTGIWEDLMAYPWHRPNWVNEADMGVSTPTTSGRSWTNFEGWGQPNSESTSSAPHHQTNVVSSQRWSILWSMENQYRQSTAQNNLSLIPPSHMPTSSSSLDSDPTRFRHRSSPAPYSNGRHSILQSSGDTDQGEAHTSVPSRSTAAHSKPLRAQSSRYSHAVVDRTSPKSEAAPVRSHQPLTVTTSSLMQMAHHCPNLESLSLGSSLTLDKVYLETGEYESMLQPCHSAGLTLVPITVMDGAKALGKHCPKLQKLLLAGCEWVTADEVRMFVTYCQQLQTLDIRNCGRLDGRLGQLFVVGDQEKESQEEDMHDNRDKDESKDYGTWDEMEKKRLAKDHLSGTAMEMAAISATTAVAASQSVTSTEPPHSSLLSSTPAVALAVSSRPAKRVRDGAMYDLVNTACAGSLEAMSARRRRPLQGQTEDDTSQEAAPEAASPTPQSNRALELSDSLQAELGEDDDYD
ncbi:hypothetical protein B0O80DRAFT_431984 [Mortierella sp. GBAus27b]|nr:hypothetical protein BGX31_010753 [Mortierella sp. GBA43]KAI8362836.1 hypothetical protein B0O80DRAFT_431984 [Mortierella sp. GBAus27b]